MGGDRRQAVLLAFAVMLASVTLSGCADSAPAASLPPINAAATTEAVSPSPQPSPTPSPSPTPAASPTPSPTPPPPPSVEPLSTLAPGTLEYLETRERQWGFAVYLPERNAIYEANGLQPFPMASVVKVVVMFALLALRIEEGVEPSEGDLELLEAMITYSDNWAAEDLWREVGGAEGVQEFIAETGINGLDVPSGYGWGDATVSAVAMAQFLALLYEDDFLDEPSRELAIELLTAVIDGQRWGGSHVFPPASPREAFGIKNGWFPALTGWRVNTAAIALDPGLERLVFVGLTRNQESYEYAIETLERVAQRVGTVVYGNPVEPLPAGEESLFTTASEVFLPDAGGLLGREGTCAASMKAPREGAYSCESGGRRYDPCFSSAGGTEIVCDARPGDLGDAFVVAAPAAVTPTAGQGNASAPWFIVLEDGARCEAALPERPVNIDGDRVSYECEDGRLVLGPLQQSRAWWAYVVDARTEAGSHVRVATAWF